MTIVATRGSIVIIYPYNDKEIAWAIT